MQELDHHHRRSLEATPALVHVNFLQIRSLVLRNFFVYFGETVTKVGLIRPRPTRRCNGRRAGVGADGNEVTVEIPPMSSTDGKPVAVSRLCRLVRGGFGRGSFGGSFVGGCLAWPGRLIRCLASCCVLGPFRCIGGRRILWR